MNYNDLPQNDREKLTQFALDYLRDYAYKNGSGKKINFKKIRISVYEV